MFKRYKPFFKAGAMNYFAYKFSFYTWILIAALQIACIVFLWTSIYKNSTNGMDTVINGFTFKEMIVFVVIANIFNFVTMTGDTLWAINEDIKKGTIDLSFTKPISYRGRFIFETLGNYVVINLILGFPLFIISYLIFYFMGYIAVKSILDLVLSIVLFLIGQVIACLLYDTLNYICGVLCFYTSSGWGINQTKNVLVSFLSGTLLPLAFFPGYFGEIVKYLPFAGLANNPILILLGKADILTSIHYVGFSLSWLIILNILASLLFFHASKKITVQGG